MPLQIIPAIAIPLPALFLFCNDIIPNTSPSTATIVFNQKDGTQHIIKIATIPSIIDAIANPVDPPSIFDGCGAPYP